MARIRQEALLAAVLAAVALGLGASRSNAQEEFVLPERTRTMWDNGDPCPGFGLAAMLSVVLGLVGAYLAVVAAVEMRRNALVPPELLQKLDALVADGKFDEAKELCAPATPFANVVYAGLCRSDMGQDSVFRAITLAAENETIVMRQRAGRVMLIGIVIVFVGLLGTLVAVIEMLSIIAAMEGAANQADLALGTSYALVPLCWGLGLFAPLFFVYWFLRDRALKLGHEMKMWAEELLCRVAPSN